MRGWYAHLGIAPAPADLAAMNARMDALEHRERLLSGIGVVMGFSIAALGLGFMEIAKGRR